jgi:alkanesulfonate monooxygenase SsuD/methylene tetrahydromethanopterin reductase-like flavin-dependent oxidoreductase (luciferase family)
MTYSTSQTGQQQSALRYSVFSVHDHYPDLPRSVAELYAEAGDQCVLAENLGYHGFFVAEHHFAPYGSVPNPAVLLANLAAKTKTIRLGSAISVLSYHPAFEVAENYAMVDIMSGGRVTLGVGSGYLAHEMAGYKVDLATKRERYDEALTILETALSGERFSYEGKFNSIQDMQLNVKPLQAGGLPLYVAVSAPPVAYYVGKQRRGMMFVPYSQLETIEDIGLVISTYRKGEAETEAESGSRPARGPGDVVVAFHAHVAETDELARSVARGPFELYLRTRQRAKHQSFDAISGEDGLSLVGSPDTVARKLLRLYDEGVRHVTLLHNFGAMPAAATTASMRLFAEQVMPKFDAFLAERQAETVTS